MLPYVLAGLALGSIYAIAASSLVVTYVSAGVLNFAFGSMAYFIARFYYWLNSQHNWGTDTAGAFSLLVVAPLLGVVLYALLFRHIRGKPTLVKLVATIGLSVALPPIADITFGTQSITSAPGLASLSDTPFDFLGTPLTTDQIIIYGFLAFVVLLGTVVLRLTDVGLRIRALVDSEAMASLSGTNPGLVAVGVWAFTTTLAGLAGILVAPSQGLTTAGMTTLMAAAFAAVVVARLHSLTGAVAAALAMGVVTDVIQKYLPPNSPFTAAIIPSIPFVFIVVALVYYLLRAGSLDENVGLAGPLDQAVKPANQEVGLTAGGNQRGPGALLGLIPIAIVALLPLIFRGSAYWLGLVTLGMCYAVIFLTFTLVTGEGGMLWLSQVIFAGMGALAAAQFVQEWHVPVLLAIVMGGVIAAALGAIIGLLTICLGDLYVALVTLTFGLLVEGLVFTMNQFAEGGLGVVINRPSFAQGNLAFCYLTLAVFLIFAILLLNLRRSTSGMALRAVRDSQPASRTLGLSVLQVKVIVGSLGAFVAAVGGGFLALYSGVAQPLSYDTFAGLVWLAVVVTLGVRSISAAALAGMAFALGPGLVATYMPTRWAELPAILFGLGAIGVAQHPEGAVLQNGAQIRGVIAKAFSGAGTPKGAPEAERDGAGEPVASAAVGSGSADVNAKAAP